MHKLDYIYISMILTSVPKLASNWILNQLMILITIFLEGPHPIIWLKTSVINAYNRKIMVEWDESLRIQEMPVSKSCFFSS